jgi:diacylglycerol kinase (ATP)
MRRFEMNKEKIVEMNTKNLKERTVSSQKPHVIINPASAGGKTRRKQVQILQVIERNVGKRYSLCVTQRPFEASFSARRAITRGSELIITIGGDGTIQETVNGFFSNGCPINPACQLGIIDSGTGSGFAQSMGLPLSINEQLEIIFRGQTRSIDIGKAVFSDKNGKPRQRYFVNESQAGIGGAVVKNVQSKHKKLGGLVSFGSSTLLMAFRHPNQFLTVVIDDIHKITEHFIGIVIANGKYMAGGMNLTPQAKVDDGWLDILLIHGQSIPQRLLNFPKIYSGRHIDSSKFSYYRGKRIALSSSEKVLFEADGELLGSLPCTVEIVPSVLKVRSNFLH